MFACTPLAPFEFPHFLLSLFLQHMSQGNVDTLALQAKLTRAWEATAAVEVAHVVEVLAIETST
jgi:hypothetical protein